MTNDTAKALVRSAAQMGIVATGLQDFAKRMVRLARLGDPLSDYTLAVLAGQTITAVKNGTIEGLSIEDDAETMTRAVETLQTMLDTVVRGA